MKVLIPMSGMSSRFSNEGYQIPKYLIELNGKKVIEHIINLYPKDCEFIFILNEVHEKMHNVSKFLDTLCDNKNVIIIDSHKKGPVYTISCVYDLIKDDEPVIINYCDFSMYWDYQDFENFVNDTQCDGSVVCYTGFHPHMLGGDNYAFCKTDPDNRVLDIREKQPFTDNKMSEYASTGTYYFKKGKFIKKYFDELIGQNINLSGEYYVSLVYNLLIKDNFFVNVYEVPYMLQWGTPLDLNMYLKWSHYYEKALLGQKNSKIENCTTLIPMAGFGSRFSKEGFDVPKPFIEVNNDSMVNQSIKCLPKTDKVLFGCLKEHKNFSITGDVIWFDEVPPGQACTTEKMLECVEDESILISACDNGVFYDSAKFLSLIEDLNNDIIVWSYKDNYASFYNPDMYSWLEVDKEQNITNVNVKKFKGNDPLNEYAIVGTMFFRNKEIYLKSLYQMYNKNKKVNNEFYIDTLLNESIKLGYKVKNFEIDNYICWGTPNDLKTYQYWQKFFSNVDWHPYNYINDYFTKN